MRKNRYRVVVDHWTDTPNGRILEETVKNSHGGFRTRGAGNIVPRDDGCCDIADYTLYTVDYTDNPA